MSDEKQQALFETWADHAFGPSTKLPQTERFTSYWKCWQAALASQQKPAQLVSDKEYLRIFDEARHGSPNPVGLMRGIRACIAAYELAQPKPAPNPLLTPRDWQAQGQREASELLGTPEGAAKLVEAKRYGMLADALEAQQKPAPVLLTDEEIDIAWRSVDYTAPYDVFRMSIARAIESAVLRKNGWGA